MSARVESSRPLNRRWTVCLLHHAHTDIGYTDLQHRIARQHADYLDQALVLGARAAAGDAGLDGFVWNSECFWSIEQWLRVTPPARHAELTNAIRAGTIGLSGSYQHFTELIDDHTLRRLLARARKFAAQAGVPLDTAISADVNGFSWGYAQALHDAGIRNFLVCLHPHHGRAPLAQVQRPFHWLTPRGDRLLVWLGEHYMFGNMLGLAPGGVLTYSFTDEFVTKPATPAQPAIAAIRLPRYLRQLEESGYPADFVPIHVSGLVTDNSPPSGDIARFVHTWNAQHGDSIRLEMTTATAFAARVRTAWPEIPEYSGDWPDWWSDGVGSVPAATRLCRHAQREFRYRRELARAFDVPLPTAQARGLEDAIALFTEHTFGHCHSVHTPWNLTARALAAGKLAFASDATQRAGEAIDDAFRQLGAQPVSAERSFRYVALNPLAVPVRDAVKLALDSCDFHVRDVAASVIDVATGRELPHQRSAAPHGFDLDVLLELAPGERRELELREGTGAPAVAGADDAAAPTRLETAHAILELDPTRGIVAWRDRASGRSLLRDDAFLAPFTPISELTPIAAGGAAGDMGANPYVTGRTRLGINRKGADAQRTAGRLTAIRPHERGALRVGVQLDYEVPGCAFFRVLVSAWQDLPRVDVTLQLHKESRWEPENLYVALPFAPGGDPRSDLWVDKPGGPLRPWRDQLPFSLLDFTCVQDGFVVLGRDLGLVVATPDAPLLQLGPLEHGDRRLMDAAAAGAPLPVPHSWLMTNFWETNFEASLAGFHEFTYRLEWSPTLTMPAAGVALCQALNHGLKNFRRTVAPASRP